MSTDDSNEVSNNTISNSSTDSNNTTNTSSSTNLNNTTNTNSSTNLNNTTNTNSPVNSNNIVNNKNNTLVLPKAGKYAFNAIFLIVLFIVITVIFYIKKKQYKDI